MKKLIPILVLLAFVFPAKAQVPSWGPMVPSLTPLSNFIGSNGVTITTPGNIGFKLLGGPNGGSVLPVPTFYPVGNNETLALDLSPRGTPMDLGYGVTWNDICTTDQITSGALPTTCLHLSAGTSPSRLAVASAEYSGGTFLPLYFGQFNGDIPQYIDTAVINTDAAWQELNGYVRQLRTVTASGAVIVVKSDHIICVNKTVGSATIVNLFATPRTGTEIWVKDCKGDANTNNITVTPAAGNIDGTTTLVINTAFGVWRGVYNGTAWSTM